jgi:hypothetical protein
MSNAARRPTMPPRSIPEDIDLCEKARGLVQLPHSIQWSGPRRWYDLDVLADRARVYEQVLREGTEQDIRRFIDVAELVAMWDELYLPAHVREVWRDWLARTRGVNVRC